MTDSPSEAEVVDAADEGEEGTEEPSGAAELAAFAESMAQRLGATSWSADHGVARLEVDRESWVAAAVGAREEGLPFFSWLAAVDWSKDVEVGEPVEAPDELEERFDVICRLSSVRTAEAVHLVTSVPKDDAWVPSLVGEFGGAQWHERETAEMFGIDFPGNSEVNRHLYLPDAFEGHPLLKSYPLLSREVKPWPGTVDVEDMPSTENVEAASQDAAQQAGDDEGDEA